MNALTWGGDCSFLSVRFPELVSASAPGGNREFNQLIDCVSVLCKGPGWDMDCFIRRKKVFP